MNVAVRRGTKLQKNEHSKSSKDLSNIMTVGIFNIFMKGGSKTYLIHIFILS